tara:strand:+ start:430 stop:642 length:213 start_codon:yes stop_codon:yes gene_type:complete
MLQIEYTNKPSVTTLKAALKKAAANGETWVQLSWGENQITIEKTDGLFKWFGRGWIGRNGGQDLADTLNK